MANLRVTYADMENSANQLTAGKGDIEQRLKELETHIQNLVNEGYVTEQSSVAFNEQFREFTTGATQCIGALDGLSDFLRKAAQAMRDTDQGLAGAIRG